jgi:uncharacterized damage-inducible protein DinB
LKNRKEADVTTPVEPGQFVISCLDQSESLLLGLPAGAYAKPVEAVGGSIGGHLRHCLEHVGILLAALDSGEVFFEDRRRDEGISSRADLALAEIHGLRQALAQAAAEDRLERTLRARSSLSGDLAESVAYDSSAKRELVYVGLHFVHHMAFMAIAARLMGHDPGAEFGKAPATLSYERSLLR